MGVYNEKSILDDKCIPVQKLNRDNLSQYCTNDAVPHKGLIIRWLKTVGVENGVIGFKNTFDPISGKMIGNFEYKRKNEYGWSNVDIFLFENYNIKEEDFEAYLEKKQKFEDFKDSWRRYRYMIFGLTFVIPVALFSLFVKDKNMAMYAYATGFLLCMLIYITYLLIEANKAKNFRNNPYETFIKALLSWEANK